MYNVSPEYIQAIKGNYIESQIVGNIVIGNTTHGFNNDNIISGSFVVQHQCCESTKFEIGTVFTNELTATFTGLPYITRYNWFGAVVAPSYRLKLANDTWEEIPMGEFYIKEANWTADGVRVKAYDGMSLFEEPYDPETSPKTGTMYTFINDACNKCGVTLALSASEFGSFPNGIRNFNLAEDNDIETYRDLISWCAQTMASFATFSRRGSLTFKNYTKNVRDVFAGSDRFMGASFSDYVVKFGGVCVSRDPIDIVTDNPSGMIYYLGRNPFLQDSQEGLDPIFDSLKNVEFVPFSATVPLNAAYDLGDCIRFTESFADGEQLYCINRMTFSYPHGLTIEGVGENPALATAKSRAEKMVETSSGGGNGMNIYIVEESQFDPTADYPEGALIAVVEDYSGGGQDDIVEYPDRRIYAIRATKTGTDADTPNVPSDIYPDGITVEGAFFIDKEDIMTFPSFSVGSGSVDGTAYVNFYDFLAYQVDKEGLEIIDYISGGFYLGDNPNYYNGENAISKQDFFTRFGVELPSDKVALIVENYYSGGGYGWSYDGIASIGDLFVLEMR